MLKICHHCGKEFYSEHSPAKYCSRYCSSLSRQEDLTGKRFGRLKVLNIDTSNKKRVCWICQCDCGNKITVFAFNLKKGNTKSCGCFRKEKSRIFASQTKTHGMTKTRLYKTWCGIKRRCFCKKDPSYKNYGERGIQICDEWKNDFMSFYTWAMQSGYKYTLTIDRIDVNGNYCPENCRWATSKEQARNTRTNHIIEHNGERHCIAEWAEIMHIKRDLIDKKLKKGVPDNAVIEEVCR
jgi:hypothetical protein